MDKFDEQQLTTVSIHLMRALDALLHRHVLHRDIKPANIFVNREPLATVLCDFGAAVIMHGKALNNEGTVTTPGYESPEMLRSEDYGFASDVWSAGVSLAEAASGASLSGHDDQVLNRIQKHMQVANHQVIIRRQRSMQVVVVEHAKLCGTMLRIAPADRPSPAALLLKVRGT